MLTGEVILFQIQKYNATSIIEFYPNAHAALYTKRTIKQLCKFLDNSSERMWTFLAGVGAVIAPLILHLYGKRQKREQTKTKASDKVSRS
jgi:hypothetical protein